MALKRSTLEDIIFGQRRGRRFTQDSPVLPDVWLAYNPNPDEQDRRLSSGDRATRTPEEGQKKFDGYVDLLLESNRHSSPGELFDWIVKRLRAERQTSYWKNLHATKPLITRLSYNESNVVAKLRFDELVRVVLPLTRWWMEYVWKSDAQKVDVQKSDGQKPDDVKKAGVAQIRPRQLADLQTAECRACVLEQLEAEKIDEKLSDLCWMIEIIGRLQLEYEHRAELDLYEKNKSDNHPNPPTEIPPTPENLLAAFLRLTDGMDLTTIPPNDKTTGKARPVLWSINQNRMMTPAVWKSVPSIKADAAMRLFNLSCKGLCWAVVDSGIDARHPAFRRRRIQIDNFPEGSAVGDPANSRIRATFDFTRLRDKRSYEVNSRGDLILSSEAPSGVDAPGNVVYEGEANAAPNPGGPNPAAPNPTAPNPAAPPSESAPAPQPVDAAPAPLRFSPDEQKRKKRERAALRWGKLLDWPKLLPQLQIRHDSTYQAPQFEHGTHVAGILAGDWRCKDHPKSPDEQDLCGVCVDLDLMDLRVLGNDGRGDEFAVLAALQFVRWYNSSRDVQVIHGMNISLSLIHDVANFACGRTPVCDECERLVGSGVVVVAAAGNEGYAQFTTPRGPKDGYRSISITDPGNAEGVITVGATHRFKPHTYGVSYFSSRGPTGDGRCKPDLVAPGEKIKSMTPRPQGIDDWSAMTMDGTSMAAPHVSGAAALLMARHSELIGQPQRIKSILCKSATDLGRERFFQGAGMLDVLRALQSV